MNLNKKKIQRLLSIFLGLFIIANILLYAIEYKRYVSSAPLQLKEARKDIVNAIMFHIYYTFFVKIMRIDFLNPILNPLKIPRDYFYNKGINKLPEHEAERAIWFDMFEVVPYNSSVKGKYGSMARRYGQEFSKDFINKVYENIKLLSLYKVSDKNTPDISEDVLEIYIDLINFYIYDFHLHPKGTLLQIENMHKVSTDSKQYERFLNIYKWEYDLLTYYRSHDARQFKRVMNKSRGWYSAYKNYFDNRYIISSFILFYKIKNDTFNCEPDIKYQVSQRQSIQVYQSLLKAYPKTSKLRKTISRQIFYLFVPNENYDSKQKTKIKNVLDLKINCKQKEKEI
ncbi:MAG: hypothetical protein COA44_12725 [Arcobacter sp.]|nr:MAG: hypothetical protein COA44_12725 [Arcobacter sp.]